MEMRLYLPVARAEWIKEVVIQPVPIVAKLIILVMSLRDISCGERLTMGMAESLRTGGNLKLEDRLKIKTRKSSLL